MSESALSIFFKGSFPKYLSIFCMHHSQNPKVEKIGIDL
ncbi:unnamed protein product [Brassica oleracea]|uniref:(rape) hypothetical protein n=1 Tax=Brassica napus TaxID=3708 RepID=A0A816K6L6_BRANA|nr:unnamed protein product [Brassica napus]